MEDIRSRLKAEHPLPPLPAVARRLLELLNHDAPFDEIGAVLATDPAMAARVLRVANSAAVRGATEVASLPEAFLRLGTGPLRQLILGLVFVHHFPRRGAFDYVAFWRHSLHVAIAAQLLERFGTTPRPPSPEAYTAGLLHDIGIAFLNLNATTKYKEVIVEARASADALEVVERRLLGVDHQEAAAFLLGEWKFPANVIAACRHHGSPAQAPAPHRALVDTIHVADALVWGLGFDNGAKRVGPLFDPEQLAPAGVAPARYDELVGELRAQADHIEASLV